MGALSVSSMDQEAMCCFSTENRSILATYLHPIPMIKGDTDDLSTRLINIDILRGIRNPKVVVRIPGF